MGLYPRKMLRKKGAKKKGSGSEHIIWGNSGNPRFTTVVEFRITAVNHADH